MQVCIHYGRYEELMSIQRNAHAVDNDLCLCMCAAYKTGFIVYIMEYHLTQTV